MHLETKKFLCRSRRTFGVVYVIYIVTNANLATKISAIIAATISFFVNLPVKMEIRT